MVELETAIPELLEKLGENIYQKALKNMQQRTWTCTTMEEIVQTANQNTGYIRAMWCGEEACEDAMKEQAGLSSRCMPFEQEQVGDVCPVCGQPAKHLVVWGKAY